MKYLKCVQSLALLFLVSTNAFANKFDHAIAFDQARLKVNFKKFKIFKKQGTIRSISDINKYSINLMWINKTLDETQPYISNAKDEESLKRDLLDPVLKWARANPTAEVNLWYNSAHSTNVAVKNTLSVLQKESESKNIRLRDVQEIDIVRKNPDAFSDQMSPYYRIDMFKLIIIVHSIENEGKHVAMFSDLEVGNLREDKGRMGKEELFSPMVMQDLIAYGLLLNDQGGRGENQFLQLVKNREMIFSIKHIIINNNLARAEFALNFPVSPDGSDKWKRDELLRGLGQGVYASTQNEVFNYYNSLRAGLPIKVRPDVVGRGKKTDPWIDYNPEDHGYTPLGNAMFLRCGIAISDLERNVEFPDNVLKFPFKKIIHASPRREMKVRNGRDHHFYEIISRPPASLESSYRVQFYDLKKTVDSDPFQEAYRHGVGSTQKEAQEP